MPMYARGSMAKALCMRCGLLFLLPELVFDGYYPNLRVCTGCYDPPQPQEKLAIVSDPEALWKPSPDAMYISPPVLSINVVGANVELAWSGFNCDSAGNQSGGANITAGYLVQRSIDSITWQTIKTLSNTADEWGALIVETDSYIDTPGVGTFFYRVFGYDVLFNDPMG